MQIYPAIDIQRGQTVHRFAGGADDPVEVAHLMLDQGASWIHAVDMDRAFGTGGDNSGLIRSIAAIPGVRLQLGGLLQASDDVLHGMDLGAERIVLATATLTSPGLLESIIRLGASGRFAVAIDVRKGRPALRAGGTLLESPIELADRARQAGVQAILYRDLDRDGHLAGLDLPGAAELRFPGRTLLLAGGSASLNELVQAKAAGLDGVVLGRALYEPRFTLKEAIECSAS